MYTLYHTHSNIRVLYKYNDAHYKTILFSYLLDLYILLVFEFDCHIVGTMVHMYKREFMAWIPIFSVGLSG